MVFNSKLKYSRAQGTIEYLILLSVVAVIALIAVGTTFLVINPVELEKKASVEELKILDISIGENSYNNSTGEFVFKLKNNFSSRISISNIKIGDSNSNYDQNLLAGASSIFILSSIEECTNNEIIKTMVITFTSKQGLEHLQTVKGVSFSCNNADLVQSLRFFYIPQRNLVDGVLSNMTTLSDGNYSFSFSSGAGDAIAYYSFESANGSTVEDLVGSADGTLVNGASIGSGGMFSSNALIISADNQAFDIPDFSSSQITMSAWYYYDGSYGNGWNTLFCRSGGSYHHLLINDDSREIGFYNNSFYSSGTTFTPGTLYHIAIVKDGYNEKIYLNGNLIMNSDSSFDNLSYPLGTIGAYVDSGGQGARGWIDEVKIWDRVLSESEVLAEYNSTGTSEDSNYVTKLIDTKKTTTSFDSVMVNPNGLKYGEEIDPESESSLANGLVGLWHLDESSGTTVIDSSGNGYNGVRSSEPNSNGITKTVDGDYTVYSFTSSGNFTIDSDITAEVLVVAGGGGGGEGGGGRGAGGGAGGLIHNLSYSISSGSHNVTVGAGGIGATTTTNGSSPTDSGENGEDSVFDTLTAIGGGGGGGGDSTYGAGKTGGSGGGGWYVNSGANGTTGQGYAGGNGYTSPKYGGGGGGGAGEVGQTGTPDHGGNGGNGLLIDINGTPAYYAGGGSADIYGEGGWGSIPGTPGLGGGGTGHTNSIGTNGINGLGGGGGGNSANGGSGTVIIRYLTSQGTATISSSSSSGLWGTIGGTFNGTSDYIQVPLATSSVSNVTLSAWFKTNNYAKAGQIVVNVGSDASGNGYGFAVNNESTTDGSLLILYSSINWYDTGVNITDGGWHHGVLVLNGSSQPSFYLDGELVASPSTSIPNIPTSYIEIGRNDYPNTARYFNGSVDEVAVWNRAFSASEVSDLFNKGVAKIGISARACSSEDCSTEWSAVEYGSSEYKYFSLPRSKYFQFKITSELIPFDAQRIIPESCVSPNGANYSNDCWNNFGSSYDGCSKASGCSWSEYEYCYSYGSEPFCYGSPYYDCSYMSPEDCQNGYDYLCEWDWANSYCSSKANLYGCSYWKGNDYYCSYSGCSYDYCSNYSYWGDGGYGCNNYTNGNCYWYSDYYCYGNFTCENQLGNGSVSCNALGSICSYTAPSTTDYESYFYNATPKLIDLNILYRN